MFKLLKYKHLQRLIGLIMLDILLFGSINAANAASYMIIVGFILLALTIYHILYCLLALSRFYGLKIKHKHQLALYITLVLGILIALQSTGELGSRDVWVLLPLVILGYFYSTYARSSSL